MGNLTNKQKSNMFRFVALFALVAVAFAEPEADSQFVYSNVAGVPVHGVYNTYAGHVVSPVVKPGVPEDTDSVKLAKEQHKFAQHVQKVNKVQYVAPYTTYAGVPYVHHPVATHFIAKREAEAEADPAVFYNAYNKVYSPYTTGYTYSTPYVHAIGKREAEADSDAALYYRTYGYNYGSPYTYNYGASPYTYGAYPYRNVYGAWY